MPSTKPAGFSLVEIVVAISIVAIIGLGLALYLNTTITPSPASSSQLAWTYTNNKWHYAGQAQPPTCPQPLLSTSPLPLNQASEILYPGQWRNGDYKAHGGIAASYQPSSALTVTLPLDADLISITKYLDQDSDPQYLLTFLNPCGIMLRFDHLNTLSATLQPLAQSLPVQTSTISAPPTTILASLKAGSPIATGAGIYVNKTGGGFDFGLYDLRQPNTISTNPTWAAIHQDYAEQTFYGRCWIDYLPQAESTYIKDHLLPLATDDRGASDYCSFAAGGTTLDYNQGQPVTQHATPNRAL